MLKNLKKYIPKRKYRERGQLESRKNLGFLEKKQDYKKRADNFHEKEKRYKKLKEQARSKNPDEFYFKMANAKMIDGDHVVIKEEKSMEEKLARQNKLLNLINHKKSVQEKEKEKLLANLKLFEVGDKQINSLKDTSIHQLYFDNQEDLIKFNAGNYFESNEEFLKKKTNRVKNSQLYKVNKTKDENEDKKNETNRKLQFKKLTEKIKNVRDLDNISKALSYQKELIVIFFIYLY